ncbi:MAG TPA: hypothetical protein VM533_09960, partial [Fimbriiglobus sp.]|nr:hypothetical protein [Fimbriiglobus sp.]
MSRHSKNSTRTQSANRVRKPFSPRLEYLEDRAVPTAYVVNTTDDGFVADGNTSLREAMFAATLNKVTSDAAAGSPTDPDEITFNLGAGSHTISLSKFGLLPIISSNCGPLSILGPTSESLTLSGGKTVQYGLNVDGQTDVVIRDLTMTGFAAAAVRVADGGSATVQGCELLVNDGHG